MATRKPSRRDDTLGSLRSPITELDRDRYFDFLAGVSAEELAARENVRLPTIERSLDKMRSHTQVHSQQSAELAVREVVISQLAGASAAFTEALTATIPVTKMVMKRRWDDRTGEEVEYMDEEVTLVPDHATRMKAVDSLQKLLVGIQPKTPLIDARSQNIFQPGTGGQAALPAGSPANSLSQEAVVRAIRSARGLSLGDGQSDSPISPQPVTAGVEVDMELAAEMAEMGHGVVDAEIYEDSAESAESADSDAPEDL